MLQTGKTTYDNNHNRKGNYTNRKTNVKIDIGKWQRMILEKCKQGSNCKMTLVFILGTTGRHKRACTKGKPPEIFVFKE